MDRSYGTIRWRRLPSMPANGHHRPRSTEDTLPNRISTMREVTNPDGVHRPRVGGKPGASEASIPSGDGMLSEANAGGRKAKGIHNLPDRPCGRRESVPTESERITQKTLRRFRT